MSEKGKEKAQQLLKEIMQLSYPLCKHRDPNISRELAIINNKAYELQKLIEHREVE